MLSRYPLAWRLVLFLVVPALVVATLQVHHFRKSLPLLAGSTTVSGIRAAVTVTRDDLGVPYIVAESDRDAFAAIGYVHAQDRMWQLELQRRIARGRLSEVFGKASVQQDIWFRTLGLEQAARDSWDALSPEAQQSLQAYADGINAWLTGSPVLPPEFRLLGISPEPWTVIDSLAWAKVFALNLGGNHVREMERLMAEQLLGQERAGVLFPDYSHSGSGIALSKEDGAALAQYVGFQKSLETTLHIGGRHVGSNAWAVAGRHTVNGAALLANDPHLGLQIPSLWYMAAIRGDRIDVSGATLVGLPVVVFGRNRTISWGGTNLMADAQDVYFEQVKPDDSSVYRAGERWEKFETRTESIEVRQAFPAALRGPLRPVRIQVRKSRHGPIISDLQQSLKQPAALRWTALDPDDTSYDSFLRLNYAGNWDEFQEALRGYVAPAMNMLYADTDGNIGVLSAGRMPIRSAGDGSLPVPGWSDDHHWVGWIPFDAWPRTYNPDSGFVVSANNKPVGDDYPYLITRDWAPPARADRISALLGAAVQHRKLDLDAMLSIQSDQVSQPARLLLQRLLRHVPNTAQQHRAMSFLRNWDGDMQGGSQAAAIFNAWTRQIKRGLLADDVRGYWTSSRGGNRLQSMAEDMDLEVLTRLLDDPSSPWCDNLNTPAEREDCDDVIDSALDDALRELNKISRDASMQSWTWGDMHEAWYRHVPFSENRLLRSVFERRIGTGGSPDSINVATYSASRSGGRYTQDFGAGVRQLFEMSPEKVIHLYMNSTGQSGNFLSNHYDDMIEPFRDVEMRSMQQAEAAGNRRLVLLPDDAVARGASK